MKKVFLVLTALLLCFTLPVKANANAASFVTAQPYYEQAKKVYSGLVVSGTTAICNGTADANPDVVKIVATQYLQKQGFLWIWSTYDGAEWTKTAYKDALDMSNTKTGLSSGKYRLKTVFTLTDKQGKTENITVYSDEKSV